jgi:GNAT superfamily N-acetyltransferase
MIHQAVLDGKFIVRTATLEDAAVMEYVQKQCFPTLHPSELMDERHFSSHIRTFQEGQLVIEHEGKIIGSASTLRCHFPEHDHTFLESSDNLWITNAHKPNGEWMYGIDMGVLPEFRGLGLSKELYKARHQVCRNLGIIGQIISGMTIGYGKVKDQMSIQEYCERLEREEFTDPTITPQRRAGFRWIRPIYGYINDEESGHASILMYYPVDENYTL